MSKEDDYYIELISYIKLNKPSKRQISKKKIDLCKELKVKNIPTDIQVLMHCKKEDLNFLRKYLYTKPGRTMSGVAVVAIMSKPYKCPHGKCIMCPGGPKSFFGKIPQSYTGKEPATMRAIRNEYDPYLQIMNRLEQYVVLGQNPEKVELIIMGGTFISFPKQYRDTFIRLCYQAMNDFSRLFYRKNELDIEKFRKFFGLPGKVGDKKRVSMIKQQLRQLKKKNTTIEKEQQLNEKSNIRCVGLTIETRPDYANKKHALEMLRYGCTRVELGVQSVYDKALLNIERGHTVTDSINATRILKDMGLKINYHVMPGLPDISKKQDIDGLKEFFFNPHFRPDMLKIYACMIMQGTKLYKLYKQGKFKPLSTQQAMDIIIELKKVVPKYCRIMRVQRDIPTYVRSAGVDRTNLRQMISALMKQKKLICNCIRCREIKHEAIKGSIKLEILDYQASKGREYFISLTNKDRLLGFCRMRFPSQDNKEAIIRELHVYGAATAIGKKGAIQHKGFGRQLLKKAEEIAKKKKKSKMVVISGVGVREYYRKFGYKKQGFYMVKKLA